MVLVRHLFFTFPEMNTKAKRGAPRLSVPRAPLPPDLVHIFETMVAPPKRDHDAEMQPRPTRGPLYSLHWTDWSGNRFSSRPLSYAAAFATHRRRALILLADSWGPEEVMEWLPTCTDGRLRQAGRDLRRRFLKDIARADVEPRQPGKPGRPPLPLATPSHAPQLARALGISEALAAYLCAPSI